MTIDLVIVQRCSLWDAWDESQAPDAVEGQTAVRWMQISMYWMKQKCRIHTKHLCFNIIVGQPASQQTSQQTSQPASKATRSENMINIFLMHFETNQYTVWQVNLMEV